MFLIKYDKITFEIVQKIWFFGIRSNFCGYDLKIWNHKNKMVYYSSVERGEDGFQCHFQALPLHFLKIFSYIFAKFF